MRGASVRPHSLSPSPRQATNQEHPSPFASPRARAAPRVVGGGRLPRRTVSGGLTDLLRALLGADEPPVPAAAARVLAALLASLVDRLEAAACAQTALAHSRRARVAAGVGAAAGGVADLRDALAAIRGDVQLLLGLIAARTAARLVERQEAVLASLSDPRVGTLTSSLSTLLTSLSAVAADLDATTARLEATAGDFKAAAEGVAGAAAAEQTAMARELGTYAALLRPDPPAAGTVADWADPSRPERRTYDALVGASPPPLAVGVTGMGGLGKSTTLQLVCARLADAGAPRGEHFRGGGGGRVGAAAPRPAGRGGQDAPPASRVAPVGAAGGGRRRGAAGRFAAGERCRLRGARRPPVCPRVGRRVGRPPGAGAAV